MISRIHGTVTGKREGEVTIRNGGVSYEILVPLAVMKALEQQGKLSGEVELVTYHYFQMSQSSGVPVLIGFQNDIEKEFFEKFISVSGIGPRAACRALAEPFSSIAGAIDSGDESFLKELPGIGSRKAAEIVAKLRGKVGKYGLIRDAVSGPKRDEHTDVEEEAMAVLMQLQYKKNEAENMIQKAMRRAPGIKTSEGLLNEVYKEKKAL
jgi:holliday junction DNA helicase RuvA